MSAAHVFGTKPSAGEVVDRVDDRNRRLFWLTLALVEAAWLGALGYALSVLVG